MRRSELRQMIREEVSRAKRGILREGTWAVPKSPAESKKAYRALEQLKKTFDKTYGDDEIFDHLDGIEERMQEIDQAMEDER